MIARTNAASGTSPLEVGELRDFAGPERRGTRASRWLTVALPLVSLIALAAAWELLAIYFARRAVGGAILVPRLEEVIGAFLQFSEYWKGGLGVQATALGGEATWQGALLGLFYNSWLTIYRLALGLGLGLAVGVVGAIGISWSGLLRRLLALPAHFSRMMPLLGMVPLFQLWFAGTERGAIFFVAYAVAVIMFAITLNAIGNVPEYFIQYARSLGSSGPRIYLSVVLPAILPQIRAGLLLSLGFGWSAVIAAELLGQQYGLGVIVHSASQFGNTPLLGLVGAVIIVYSGASYFAVERSLAWMTRWAE